jgi:hypothetical protein
MAKVVPALELIKVTIRLPKELVQEAKHRAIQEECNLQTLIAEGLRMKLKTASKQKGVNK